LKRIALVIVSVSVDFLPQGKALLDQFLGRTGLRQLRQQQTQALPLFVDHGRSSPICRDRCKCKAGAGCAMRSKTGCITVSGHDLSQGATATPALFAVRAFVSADPRHKALDLLERLQTSALASARAVPRGG
jgi:hypothetical protein